MKRGGGEEGIEKVRGEGGREAGGAGRTLSKIESINIVYSIRKSIFLALTTYVHLIHTRAHALAYIYVHAHAHAHCPFG